MKRILALAGVVVLVLMYLSTLVFALMDSEFAANMLRGSVACTILIPVLLYAYILIYRVLNNRRDEDKFVQDEETDEE